MVTEGGEVEEKAPSLRFLLRAHGRITLVSNLATNLNHSVHLCVSLLIQKTTRRFRSVKILEFDVQFVN